MDALLEPLESAFFVRALLARPGEAVRDLEVRRASLEATYLALVAEAERSGGTAAA